MSTTQWLKQRQIGIGGSDVAAILGLSLKTSPYKIWKTKVCEEIENEENKFTEWGHYLEPIAALKYSKESGRKVIKDNKIRIHKDHSCLIVNLDRVIVDNGDGKGTGVLEAKSTVSHVFRTWIDEITGSVNIPLIHWAQLQHELSVTGYKWGVWVVVILDQRDTYYIPFQRDDDYIEKQNRALVAWWNTYVVNNVPPPFTPIEYNFIEPTIRSEKEVDVKALETYKKLSEATKKYKEYKNLCDSLKDDLRLFIGNNEVLTSCGETIATYKMQSRSKCNTKELRKDHPEIYNKYFSANKSRTLRIIGLENEE
jgi:putative phage-type endonuclease